jgi:putative acetyltransferase
MMQIETDQPVHFQDFIRLNEQWISEHFSLEAADRALAQNPGKVISDGGHIYCLVTEGQVLGVCALFKDGEQRFQLARMAVERKHRGKGYGGLLLEHALSQARDLGATSVYLLSNTQLKSAIRLYTKFGFNPISTEQHPVYARCNIVMERPL